MKQNKTIQKIALFALSSALVGSFAVMPAMANNETVPGTGDVVIENIDSQSTGFIGYQIFQATKNEDGSLSNFDWVSNSVRDIVVNAIKAADASYSSDNAQDAAEYLSKAYNGTTDQTTILDADSLLTKIARALYASDIASTSIPAGTATTLAEGYWLAWSNKDDISTDEAGTSPIYLIAGGEEVTINEKTGIPTIEKLVLDDADGAEYGVVADAERGQKVSYQITGTMPENLTSFTSYYYQFIDDMPEGMDLDVDSVKVEVQEGTSTVDVTGAFTAAYDEASHDLTVTCDDVRAINAATITKDSKFVLSYQASLNDDCVVGADGNINSVKLQYSSNPADASEKTFTTIKSNYLYTYMLHIEKKDRDTNVALEGAKFTIQATTPDDAASTGLYVQADGTLGADAYEFTTDADGIIEIDGLDVGTYTVKETAAPDEYAYITQDTTVTIGATYDATGVLNAMTNVVADNADATAGIDTILDVDANGNKKNIVQGDENTGVDVTAAKANITIGNIQKINMPLSGQAGILTTILIGCGVIGGSAAVLVVAKKKKKTEA